jgi:hypothetical protein
MGTNVSEDIAAFILSLTVVSSACFRVVVEG